MINTAIHLASDLKMGQYRKSLFLLYSSSILLTSLTVKIPPRVMFLTQVWGTLVGCLVNYFVMTTIVTSKRDILLDSQGTNVWSGQTVQVVLAFLAISTELRYLMFSVGSKLAGCYVESC